MIGKLSFKRTDDYYRINNNQIYAVCDGAEEVCMDKSAATSLLTTLINDEKAASYINGSLRLNVKTEDERASVISLNPLMMAIYLQEYDLADKCLDLGIVKASDMRGELRSDKYGRNENVINMRKLLLSDDCIPGQLLNRLWDKIYKGNKQNRNSVAGFFHDYMDNPLPCP